MNRWYQMSVEISDYNRDRKAEIKSAAEREWPFEEWWECGTSLGSSAEESLPDEEDEDKFAERLTVAVWLANGRFCEVIICAIYMEALPYEAYCLDVTDYERLMGQSE